MAEDFKYDVFISYSHKDEEWADKVLRQRLDDAGLKVCIDYRDFEAGKMAILNMQDAAKESKHVVLVITRNWLNSEWSLFEALMGGTQDPAGLQKKLIPLLCEDGIQKDINPFIAMRTWVDFTHKDREEIAWKQLFDTLGKPGNLKPARLNWFYGHRYGDIENFTGRTAELKMLDEWLSNDKDNLLILRALGGFGKSILTWQWFNTNVDKTKWQTAVWWSFYEKESGFESFLSETLKHLGVEVKASARQQVNDLLEAMHGTNILIVLDGFERLLRQYGPRVDASMQSDDEDADIDPSQRDCSSPLTETFLRGLSGAGTKSKVLMTTRLCPRALESADGKLLKGCRDESLSAFSPEDAVTYFHNEGIKATRAEIIAVCSAYGYHPLSLSLLVGLINEDHEKRGDIEAVKNLEIFEDVRARRHHVLERAYESLAPERRDLLSKISCFRGSMEYAVLKKVFPSPDLDKALLDLRKRGLLQYAGETQRYDMHPIVRHYAYERLTNKHKTHKRLASFFQRRIEGGVWEIIPQWLLFMANEMQTPTLRQGILQLVPKVRRRLNLPEKLDKPKTLDDLAPLIELYHHTVQAGQLDQAAELLNTYQVTEYLYYQMGAYQLVIELLRALFLDGDDKLPSLNNEAMQANISAFLASAYSNSGQPNHAVILHENAKKIYAKSAKYKRDLATDLGNLGSDRLKIGKLFAAESDHRSRIEISLKINDTWQEARGHQELGHLLSYCGSWSKAEQELNIALKLAEDLKDISIQGVTWAYHSLRVILMSRDNMQFETNNPKSAFEFAQRALAFAKENLHANSAVLYNFVEAYWLLGSAYRANNELTLAEENLSKALNLCRQINLVDSEADILLDLGRLRYVQSDFKDAQEKASEALVITERSGYVLQGADVNLFLAQYALEQEKDKVKAKAYAESALKLAYCDGPPYYYKVAYEEAVAMLERLKV